MTLDHRTAFDMAPIGLVLSAKRLIVDCNRQVLAMFGAQREQLIGQSFEVLYPSPIEFERTGARIVASLDHSGYYADDRVMKRVAGPRAGELFWCHVSGRALAPDDAHAEGIWSFEDLSAHRHLKADLTAREAAQWDADAKTSHADAAIANDGTAAALQAKIDHVLKEWHLTP